MSEPMYRAFGVVMIAGPHGRRRVMTPADRPHAILLSLLPWCLIAGGVWVLLVALNMAAIAWVTRRMT